MFFPKVALNYNDLDIFPLKATNLERFWVNLFSMAEINFQRSIRFSVYKYLMSAFGCVSNVML